MYAFQITEVKNGSMKVGFFKQIDDHLLAIPKIPHVRWVDPKVVVTISEKCFTFDTKPNCPPGYIIPGGLQKIVKSKLMNLHA